MTFGILTRDAAGAELSRFDTGTVRVIASIRIEALATGSFQIPAGINPATVQPMFQADSVIQRTPPVFDVTASGLITWRPYLTGPSLHVGGYLLVAARG